MLKKIIDFGREFILFIAFYLKEFEKWLQEGKERNKQILDNIKNKQ